MNLKLIFNRKKILLINFILISTYSFCQNYIEIFKINGNTTPYNSFDTSSSKTKINQLDVDLTVPIKLNDKLSIITGIIYEDIKAKLFEDGEIKRFGSTTIKLGANKKFNDKWAGTLVALPKIASDYLQISNKDFQLGALGLFKYKKNDNLSYKFGLYYNAELFGPFFVPMLGFYYLSPNKKFESNIMMPLQADINYKISSFICIGINFNGQTRSYHLTNVKPEYHSTYISKVSNDFYGYLKFNIKKGLSIQTKFGQSIGRSLKVYDENDKVKFGLPATYIGPKRNQLNTKFANGFIFQLSLSYKVFLDKK